MQLGKLLISTGVILIFIGVIIYWAGKIPGFGKLPGDIFIRKGSFTFYFPLATSLLISLLLSVLFTLFARK